MPCEACRAIWLPVIANLATFLVLVVRRRDYHGGCDAVTAGKCNLWFAIFLNGEYAWLRLLFTLRSFVFQPFNKRNIDGDSDGGTKAGT